MRALWAEGLRVGYHGRAVLGPVDLELWSGELVCVLGPNGAGKSTLVRTLAGVLAPVTGRVGQDGARSLAYLAQNEPLPPDFRVADVVALGRLPAQGLFGRTTTSDRHAVARALRATGCDALEHRRVDELSGGERQRVALARALAQEPRVLVLDEPTAHLDVRYQAEVLDQIATAVDLGLAALLVLHDVGLAAAYATRCLLVAGGQLVADGPPEETLVPEVLERVYEVRFARVALPDRTARVFPLVGRAHPLDRASARAAGSPGDGDTMEGKTS